MKSTLTAAAAVLWLGFAPAGQTRDRLGTDPGQIGDRPQFEVSVPKAELEQLLAAYDLIKMQYVDQADEKQVLTNAIGGMVAALDPHSRYLDKDDLDELEKERSGEYVGIGVEVHIDHGQIRVMALTEGGPAERAGMLPGDSIVSIDDVAVSGLHTDEVAKRIRGLPGSVVKLSVLGQGAHAMRPVSVTRAAIHRDTVKMRLAAPGVAWIRIAEFEGQTVADLVAALKAVDASGEPRGLVLDMRNDPGGMITAAVGVATAFLPPDTVLFSARGRMQGTNATVVANPAYYRANGQPDALADLPAWTRRVPLAVLVNGASASAAELVAGALQDHGRAKIVGTRTFGKGSIQMVLPLSADSAVKMTVARYYTPKGRAIQAQGITPDVVVAPAAAGKAEQGLQLRESDLANHLPAEAGAAIDAGQRAAAESTQMFGTLDDKALKVAIAALQPAQPTRHLAALVQRFTALFHPCCSAIRR